MKWSGGLAEWTENDAQKQLVAEEMCATITRLETENRELRAACEEKQFAFMEGVEVGKNEYREELERVYAERDTALARAAECARDVERLTAIERGRWMTDFTYKTRTWSILFETQGIKFDATEEFPTLREAIDAARQQENSNG